MPYLPDCNLVSCLHHPWLAALATGLFLITQSLGQDDQVNLVKEAEGAKHLHWKSMAVDPSRLPWAIYDPATMSLDGKNLTPGFEAMATRFGKVALRFAEMDDKVILLLNKKPVRFQPTERVELGSKGHFAYVRAADDRLMFRIGLITGWLRKNKEKAEAALGKDAMAEFENLYARQNLQAIQARGRNNNLAALELDYFLFQYLEGRPALSPIPGTKTRLADFWDSQLWAHENGKARFNHNHKKDQEFIEFHCEKFTGAEGSPFRGKNRNPPPTQLGDTEPMGS